MKRQHENFYTNGTSALKAENCEFDVYVKPVFGATNDSASIIDFNEAHARTQDAPAIESPRFRSSIRSLIHSLRDKVHEDRILGDLFSSNSTNIYRSADLSLFTKGFTVAGVATFVLILFGA